MRKSLPGPRRSTPWSGRRPAGRPRVGRPSEPPGPGRPRSGVGGPAGRHPPDRLRRRRAIHRLRAIRRSSTRRRFERPGSDEVDDHPEVVAARVKASNIRNALVAALDDWSFCARTRADSDWVLDGGAAGGRGPDGLARPCPRPGDLEGRSGPRRGDRDRPGPRPVRGVTPGARDAYGRPGARSASRSSSASSERHPATSGSISAGRRADRRGTSPRRRSAITRPRWPSGRGWPSSTTISARRSSVRTGRTRRSGTFGRPSHLDPTAVTSHREPRRRLVEPGPARRGHSSNSRWPSASIPARPYSTRLAGKILESNGKHGEALAQHRQAVALDPKFTRGARRIAQAS